MIQMPTLLQILPITQKEIINLIIIYVNSDYSLHDRQQTRSHSVPLQYSDTSANEDNSFRNHIR
jgi:hypothetical protein